MKNNSFTLESYSVEVDTFNEESWNNVIRMFNDAVLYNTWAYGIKRWGEKNISCLALKKGGEIVAASLARIVRVPLINTGIAYINWGPLWNKKGTKEDPNSKDLVAMLKALKYEYAIKRKLLLRIIPNIKDSDSNDLLKLIIDEGFIIRPELPKRRTLILSLEDEIKEIRKNFQQKWRGHLNKSERLDLTITEGYDDESYSFFLPIFNEMFERKQFINNVDVSEFREINNTLPTDFKMKILLCKHNEDHVSGLIWSAIGNTGIIIFSGTLNIGLKLNGSYILRWEALKHMKEKGCLYLDQGGIDPDANPGSYKFKVGMGGEDVSQIGQFDYSKSFLSSFIIKTADFLMELKAKNFQKISSVANNSN